MHKWPRKKTEAAGDESKSFPFFRLPGYWGDEDRERGDGGFNPKFFDKAKPCEKYMRALEL